MSSTRRVAPPAGRGGSNHDDDLKSQLAAVKSEVKAWEKRFKSEHGGRVPSAEEIKADGGGIGEFPRLLKILSGSWRRGLLERIGWETVVFGVCCIVEKKAARVLPVMLGLR